jgi:transposase
MKTIPLSLPDAKGNRPVSTVTTEGARRATGVGTVLTGGAPPDPEVTEAKPRRRFTAHYKLRILAEVETCAKPGEIGALLRREGLYSSHLTTWRRQKEQGQLLALEPKKRGRKAQEKNPLAHRVTALEKENERLRKQLRKASILIEAQKKMAEILDSPLFPEENDDKR